MAKKTSSLGRVVGVVAAVVIALVVVGLVLFLDGAGGQTASRHFTPINRDLSTAARDVLRAVEQWQDSVAPIDPDTGERAPMPTDESGPLELTVVLRERSVDELPDDLVVCVCTNLQAWCDMREAKAFAPLVAAKSPSGLGSDVVLYDGKGIVTVPAAQAPAWASGAPGPGAFVLSKRDLAGSEKTVTFMR